MDCAGFAGYIDPVKTTMNTQPTPPPYMFPAETEYGVGVRTLNGTIPTIRLQDMDVLFVSLGASREKTTAKRDEVMTALNSHAQLVAALEGVTQKLTELLEGRTMDSTLPDFYVVRNARNQARAAL